MSLEMQILIVVVCLIIVQTIMTLFVFSVLVQIRNELQVAIEIWRTSVVRQIGAERAERAVRPRPLSGGTS